MQTNDKLYLGIAAGLAGLAQVAAAQAQETVVAFDLVGSANSKRISFHNDPATPFSSPADGFGIYQRGVSPSIPFAVLDDSLSYSGDSLGIIDESNLNAFFGVSDTVNDDASGPVVATWAFDISGATELGIAIDMGAMGDFEGDDLFEWRVAIDGGSPVTVFKPVADENASHTYTLADGDSFTLNDPLTLDDTVLTNALQTFRAAIAGEGATLTLSLVARTNGGDEALVAQNIRVLSGFEPDDPVEPEPAALYYIHEIQGDGESTPLADTEVMVEALVVGDFQNNGGADAGDLRGFFLQEEESDYDSDDATSEGLFVFDGSGTVDVVPGDLVRVVGTASEYFGMTQISAATVAVLSSGNSLPAPRERLLPVASVGEFEALEGMRVTFPQALRISEYYNYDRFGEIVLALPAGGEPRAMTPTAVEAPGSNGYEMRADRNRRSRILLDDGSSAENPAFNRHPNGAAFALDNRFRGGDEVGGLTGVMHYSFNAYRVQPTAGADYVAANPRPSLPEVGGSLQVASMNVLNYFTSLDDGTDSCGPNGGLECRGADDAVELARQRDKIVAALAAMDADIVGLIEIENDNGEAAADLVAALNAALGDERYAALETGTIGEDAIKVAFIYQPRSVQPRGDFAVLDTAVDPDFLDSKNRPALAQTFIAGNGGALTVALNHFKSKGSDCDDLGDPDLGDGQGNCNRTRTDAAIALAKWLAADPTGQDAGNVLIIGDLNAYDREDPVAALVDAGYQDLLARFQGEFGYSYVFDGQFGYLDHALANAALAGRVAGAAAWHINADEPDILDYDTSYKSPAQAGLYAADAYRSSDHDPVLVGLNLFGTPQTLRECMRGGWRELRTADGEAFRNQGQCVAYVNHRRRQAWVENLWELWAILHNH
ncbi:ExeM/NucH family extracellular endonuclease [Parahaliea mediterranea]|uniref:ExeM/NucH family extracellular endonuclease n=1 Tax=Parahaliea mediterranea TaxID=651086 RepID=A0A939IKB1_9GAMM|nr:ExeM/NucH family extracellular endonuclease [Parahaliea mediterranea]MBN7797146.1 ExeM/NucH family extracellular endonuclease [Parahaliea mediterranea]